MQHEKVIKNIQFEINQIERLLKEYRILLNKIKNQEPNFTELNALALLLHSFYNGFENIFKQIARKIDLHIPPGKMWHKNLLEQMTMKTKNRNHQILTEELFLDLRKYLGFRHFTRHAYSFHLNWELMKDLVLPIETIKKRVVKQIQVFVEKFNLNSKKKSDE